MGPGTVRQRAQLLPATSLTNREEFVSFKKRLFAAAMLLGGSLGSAMSAPAWAESVLNRGIGATISTLDPQVNFLATDGFILDDIYEGLINYDANGQIIPGAAEKWDVSDDGLTYTFHLRDGLKWSNGEPLVAQDFANGIVRTIDPATASTRPISSRRR